MRPPQLIHRLGIIQLDIQVLVYTLERTADLDFVLEFDSDFVLDECLEEAGALLAHHHLHLYLTITPLASIEGRRT
jgi:hypothetical protein